MEAFNSEDAAKLFFRYSRERYIILLKRRGGTPYPWTTDHVLNAWSFCNIFREDDRTTIWFKENIREPLHYNINVLMATIAFRWFNRIETGEVLKPFLLNNYWNKADWMDALYAIKGKTGKIVTGAYMIKTPPGFDKIGGILDCLWKAKEKEEELIHILGQPHCTLEKAWSEIRKLAYMGDFTSYEVVTDLRHTFFLEKASDIDLWANPGPGCAAGLGELFFNNRHKFNRHNDNDRECMIELMRDLLSFSKDNNYWPKQWPKWELREVEHTLCEYDKYTRGWLGSRLKRHYKVGLNNG